MMLHWICVDFFLKCFFSESACISFEKNKRYRKSLVVTKYILPSTHPSIHSSKPSAHSFHQFHPSIINLPIPFIPSTHQSYLYHTIPPSHLSLHTYIPTYTNTYIHTPLHTHIHIYTYIPTHTHTHTHLILITW